MIFQSTNKNIIINIKDMLIKTNKVLYPELLYKICGILFKVHNKLGRYYNEKQYGDLIEELFKENNIFYEREKTFLLILKKKK